MYKIVRKEVYSPVTFMWELEVPDIAKAAKPGHFVIVKHTDHGERIPLTIADFDGDKGTITLVIQAVGKSTKMFMTLPEGSYVDNVVGPLGIERHFDPGRRKIVAVGGGLGIAPVFPQIRAYKELGVYTIGIIGFRTKDLIFWKEKFESVVDELHITTDDGSYGTKGFVTAELGNVLSENTDIDEVIAIGPVVMMKACAEMTKPHNIKTMVSLNPVMVDGTGMCGGCRVTVGGKMKFACIDGPDFDGHQVDFAELILRNKRFLKEEKAAIELWEHACKLEGAIKDANM